MEFTSFAQAYPIAPEPTAWEQARYFVEYLWHYAKDNLTVGHALAPILLASALLLALRLSSSANVSPSGRKPGKRVEPPNSTQA